uniref:ZP domain-containing protein n=1 Tax=Rhabditophanes sp. KR3021 TaxID=114890 RepID=A0AC35UG18_9BILA
MKNCYASFVAILSFRFFVFGNIVIGPKLECNEEGLRIHFSPTGSFSGHVYVKGYFFSQYCHLDYSSYLISHPFFFHIPYKSECNVKKERSLEPPGINYNVIVVVQNHKMFLTDADQAYSINCFFRENRTDAGTILSHSLQVSDLNVTNIDNDPVQTQPICSYQVLSGSENGSSVQFASIGDLLYHKWSCESNEMGMLVHTCIVKDAVQNSFTIIDNRGCITDKSLLQPLNYSSSLNSVYAPISAFKFADQMSVFFSCQITLCRKVLNGCEGITPPVCNYIKLPTEGGPIMPVLTPNRQPSIPLVNLIEDTIQGRPFDVTDENLFQAQSQPQILNQPSNHMIAQPQTLTQTNSYRKAHQVDPVTVNATIEKVAQDYAVKLATVIKGLKHSTGTGYGENLAFASSSIAGTAVDMWYNEVKDYDFKKGVFTPTTGHFTQLVWKNSRQVGFGIAVANGAAYIVCNYSPPGNYLGQFKENVFPKKV